MGTYKKVMKWLSPVAPERIASSRTPGSGALFVDSKRLMAWCDSTIFSVFWPDGITGAGKTTLMTTAVEKLDSMNGRYCKVAYFYYSFADSESLDIVNILASVLAQLCELEDKVYQMVETL